MDNRCPEASVAASPPPRRRNPDHPPYAVMVQKALSDLAKNEGSTDGFTEAAISRYIISAYPGIPPGHHMLLPYYLNKLVTARELSVSPSGLYLLPDSRLHEPIAPPPPIPRLNALPSRKSSLVLRFRKTISDGDGSEPKVSWCYVGDGSTSSPSITEQQSGSVATKPGGESYPPVPALMQADPEKALLLQSPSLVSDPITEVSTLGGLDEPKEPLVVPSPINKPQSRKRAWSKSRKVGEKRAWSKPRKVGGESGPPVPVSMQAEPEKVVLPPSPSLLPPSPSPVSDTNMEDISPTLGEPLAVLFPINKQQTGRKSRKRTVTKSWKRETRSEAKKAGGAPSPSPASDTNIEFTFPTLGLDEPKESLTGLCPINVQQLRSESRKQDGELGSNAKKAGDELHPSISMSKKSEPEKTLLPASPVSGPNMEGISPTLGGLDEPKKPPVVLSPSNKQQSGSKSKKQAGAKSRKQDSRSKAMKRETRSETKKKGGELRSLPLSMQAEKAPSSSAASNTNIEGLCPINVQQFESRKQDGEPESHAKKAGEESYPSISISQQSEPEKTLLPPLLSPVSGPNMEGISPTLGELDEPKEPPVFLSLINKQQSGSKSRKRAGAKSRKQESRSEPMKRVTRSETKKKGRELRPPVPVSMQAEPEKAPSPSAASNTNIEVTSPVLGPNQPKESLTGLCSINVQQSEYRKQDGELGSDAKKADEESYPSISISKQSEPEKTLLAPSLVSGTNMEGISPTLGGLDDAIKRETRSETKKKGRELRPSVPASMQAEPKKVPSPSAASDTNMEVTFPALGLDEPKELMCPINIQQSRSESRKQDGEPGSDAKKAGEESHPSVLISKQSEPEKALLHTLTLGLVEPKESLAVQSSVEEQQLASKNVESHLPFPVSMQLEPEEPEEALLPSSSPPLLDSNLECTLLDKPKESLPASIPEQQSGSESGKQDGSPALASIQAEPEKETLLPPPVLDRNMESTSPTLQLDELKELLPVSPFITDQQPGSEPMKQDVDSLAPVSIQAQLEKARLSPPPFPVPGTNMECISPTLALDKPKLLVVLSPITGQQVGSENRESLVEQQLGSENGESQVLTPITEQQLGSENGESHPPVPASMQIEPEEVFPPLPPSSDLNLEFISPILGPDKPKESLPISAPIAKQESENESRKRDGEAHLPITVSIHTKLENPPHLPPVLDPNTEWASQVLALNELKESSLVSHPITNQQSGSDPGKQDQESYLLAPDSKQANSEEVLSLPLPPSPPVLGQLQTEPVPYLPKKTSSPAPLNNEPNRERSSPALMLYELKESLPISTPIANQQSGSESSKIDADSHPSNSALMQQTDPGKEPPPPPISVQSQAEPEPKLLSPDCVPEKPSLALGEKSLSKKRRPKHRRLWYEM